MSDYKMKLIGHDKTCYLNLFYELDIGGYAYFLVVWKDGMKERFSVTKENNLHSTLQNALDRINNAFFGRPIDN